MEFCKPHFYLILALLIPAFRASGQNEANATDHFSGKTWVLRTEKMSGVGVHHPVDKDTWIEFSKDGKWRASSRIFGASEGQWRVEDNRLVLGEGNGFRIVSCTKGELQLRQRSGLSTYWYVFETKKSQ